MTLMNQSKWKSETWTLFELELDSCKSESKVARKEDIQRCAKQEKKCGEQALKSKGGAWVEKRVMSLYIFL